MTLHIFNPEHDIALAKNLSNFTAPHAGRQLRHDLGWLPVLFSHPSDLVLVDDVSYARKSFSDFVSKQITHCLKGRYREYALGKIECLVERRSLRYQKINQIMPWGWDVALREQLRRSGCPENLLPSDLQLAEIRRLSHRNVSHRLLATLCFEDVVGVAFECTDVQEVESFVGHYGKVVLKAPWSSSGRGLRFVDTDRSPLAMHAGWLGNLLASQGSVIVEPYYNKVKDFAMEFTAHADGHVSYDGLSLFHTKNGAYTGNILATESAKVRMLAKYIPVTLLDLVRWEICSQAPSLLSGYTGPFGVDMMVVAGRDGFSLHPCVEINLRCTMGHVALALECWCNPNWDNEAIGVMRIDYSDHYLLKLTKIQ